MARTVNYVLGAVFILVGIIGFFNNPVLGIFQVDAMHNVIHLVSGILAIIFAASGESAAKSFSKVFGVIYALVAILGLAFGGNILGLMTVNMADNILHIVLALVFLYVGFGGSSSTN